MTALLANDLSAESKIDTQSRGTSLQAFDPSFGPNTPGRDLSAYMTSVNSIAILSPEHELELAKQYYYEDNVDGDDYGRVS